MSRGCASRPAEAGLAQLLREIQDGAASSDTKLCDVLRRAWILAARLSHQQLRDWVAHELEGYPDVPSLPPYRRFIVEPRGHFVGSFGREVTNVGIPPMSLPKEHEDLWSHIDLLNEVAYLESLVANPLDGSLRANLPQDFVAVYGNKIYQGMHAAEIWKPLPISNIVGMLDIIRNRLLNFALEMKDQLPTDLDSRSVEARITPETVTHIYHTTIMSATGNFAIGGQGTSQTSVLINVGDYEGLGRYLASRGVSADDIADLRMALDSDPRPDAPNRFGENVSRWLGQMTEKAASGTWDVGVQAAGTLLANALALFFGWGRGS